jgi:hypothetical protein
VKFKPVEQPLDLVDRRYDNDRDQCCKDEDNYVLKSLIKRKQPELPPRIS